MENVIPGRREASIYHAQSRIGESRNSTMWIAHRRMTGRKMPGLWDNKDGQGSAVSANFQHALMQPALRTELIRSR